MSDNFKSCLFILKHKNIDPYFNYICIFYILKIRNREN